MPWIKVTALRISSTPVVKAAANHRHHTAYKFYRVAVELLAKSRLFVAIPPKLEALVSAFPRSRSAWRSDAGLGLMEAIVGVLAALILVSVILHLGRMGFAIYRLNAITGGIADELKMAREQALIRHSSVSVIFSAKDKKFGLDNNGNSRLDSIEEEELPSGVHISEDLVVTFAKSGNLAPGSKQHNIVISDARNSRRVSVSETGSIEID